VHQALDSALNRILEATKTQQSALAQQQAVLLQQQQVLAKQQDYFTKQQVALIRQEPQWYPETAPQVKLECLRETFLNGTERVERKVYSQYGEDGIIEAIFRCIGHRDKCANALLLPSHITVATASASQPPAATWPAYVVPAASLVPPRSPRIIHSYTVACPGRTDMYSTSRQRR
jgi:hypothetical protein